MKVTYLVFDDMGQLRVATKEEWNGIMAQNRTLPREQRRFFIQDCIDDCGSLDCMYIETTKAEYDKWHSAHQVRYKKRKDAEGVVILPGDAAAPSENESFLDIMDDGIDWEKIMIDTILIDELRSALAAWNDWAVDMLDLYMAGMKTKASQFISKKYGVAEITGRWRRRKFEEFVINFLK